MAAAEERSEFKFVSLQRINLKSNYKRRFKSLAGRTKTSRTKKLNRTEKAKNVHRKSDTKKSSSENLKLFPARVNQFKVQSIFILNWDTDQNYKETLSLSSSRAQELKKHILQTLGVGCSN